MRIVSSIIIRMRFTASDALFLSRFFHSEVINTPFCNGTPYSLRLDRCGFAALIAIVNLDGLLFLDTRFTDGTDILWETTLIDKSVTHCSIPGILNNSLSLMARWNADHGSPFPLNFSMLPELVLGDIYTGNKDYANPVILNPPGPIIENMMEITGTTSPDIGGSLISYIDSNGNPAYSMTGQKINSLTYSGPTIYYSGEGGFWVAQNIVTGGGSLAHWVSSENIAQAPTPDYVNSWTPLSGATGAPIVTVLPIPICLLINDYLPLFIDGGYPLLIT